MDYQRIFVSRQSDLLSMIELLFDGVFYPSSQVVLDIVISVVKARFVYERLNDSVASLEGELIERIPPLCPEAVTRAIQSMDINTYHSLTLFPGSLNLVFDPWTTGCLTTD